jgi:hypothetical protein
LGRMRKRAAKSRKHLKAVSKINWEYGMILPYESYYK